MSNQQTLIELIQERAKEKADDYARMSQERRALEVAMERTRQHVIQLNGVLEMEGRQQVSLGAVHKGRRPGNQAKDYPARRVEWQGLPVWRIIKEILLMFPTGARHRNELARQIYEIRNDADLHKVQASLGAQLYIGAKKGRWISCGHHMYRTNEVAPNPAVNPTAAKPSLVPAGMQ